MVDLTLGVSRAVGHLDEHSDIVVELIPTIFHSEHHLHQPRVFVEPLVGFEFSQNRLGPCLVIVEVHIEATVSVVGESALNRTHH